MRIVNSDPDRQFITMAWNNLSEENKNVADNTLLYLSELDRSSFLLWPKKGTNVEYLRENKRPYSSCCWSPDNMNIFMVSSTSEILIKSSAPEVTTLFSVSNIFSAPFSDGTRFYFLSFNNISFRHSILLFSSYSPSLD